MTAGNLASDNSWTQITQRDFDHCPLIVFYEVTRACDLVCAHCRACAQPDPDPQQLSTHDARLLIDQISHFQKKPMLVLTGGDPLKRADIFDLIEYARDHGVGVSITPSATPLVTEAAIRRLGRAGIQRLAISLDGASDDVHDGVRGVSGVFDRTIRILNVCRAEGIPTQVNTTVTPTNHQQIDAMADVLAAHHVVMWSLFFLVPLGRAVRSPDWAS